MGGLQRLRRRPEGPTSWMCYYRGRAACSILADFHTLRLSGMVGSPAALSG